MAKDTKKSSKKDKTNIGIAPQTEAQKASVMKVQTLFRGAFNAKNEIDLMNKWAMYDNYVRGVQNEPLTPDAPASVTNIIKPIIDSQISDLVDKPFAITAKGREPGDHMYSLDVQHLLEFVLDKNQFIPKLTQSERDRLELGTTAIKVFTDTDALDGKGLPTFEIICPTNFFPDPKWTAARLIQECEFIIHAVPRPLSWIRRKFPKMGKYVHRQVAVPYDPTLQTENYNLDEVEIDTSQKALLIECYMKDDNGDLYCLHVANHILLEDSRETSKDKIQRRNMFPFVVIPCYTMRGTGWGQGDVEQLIPTQDMMNDTDDQIRMAARMMGNPQIAIGRGAGKGFDFHKWTNAAGLRVPMQDVNAFKVIPPVPVSRDVVERRNKGFEEADIISGRPDVNRGEAPAGGVTAASAIIALQQAGQKTVLQKSKTWKDGWKGVLELLYDEIVTNWDEPMWIRINGKVPDFHFIDPSNLKNAQVMVPNLSPSEDEDSIKQLMSDPEPVEGEDGQPQMNEPAPMMDENEQPMLDDKNKPMMHSPTPMMTPPKPMTREAEFDLDLSIGDGLPNDKAFIYQTLLQLAPMVLEGKNVVGWQELRDYLREELGLNLKDETVQPPPPAPPAPMLPNGQPNQPQVPQGGLPNVPPIA